jgi:V-type H+-transporting ATPase subunit a
MGSWYRSEEMEYVELILSEDAAHACVRELGQLGCIQFTDLNVELTPFQRRFVAYVKRCDEIERKIRYFNRCCECVSHATPHVPGMCALHIPVCSEIKKMGIPVQSAGSVDHFVDSAGAAGGREVNTGAYLLDTLESKLEKYENQVHSSSLDVLQLSTSTLGIVAGTELLQRETHR